MKTIDCTITALLLAGLSPAAAESTIDEIHRHAYGANIGWTDWRGDPAHGVAVGEYVCSGYIHAANVGWIHLGDGAPADGIRYQNNSDEDYGVNHLGFGNLRGHAYGANIGWIQFEETGNPRVDLASGELSGFAYSANCGWIGLGSDSAHVETDFLQPGADSDLDGITDAWELERTGTLTACTATGNLDGDALGDLAEAEADTDPLDAGDYLKITFFRRWMPEDVEIHWTAKPTRLYRIDRRGSLDPADPWQGLEVGPESVPGWDGAWLFAPEGRNFYRVRAVKPLSP